MLVWLALSAAAATLDVKQSCGAASDCYGSIGAAVAVSSPGDKILVHQMANMEDEITLDHALIIQGVRTGDVRPVVRFTGDTFDGFFIDGSAGTFEVEIRELQLRPSEGQRALSAFGPATVRATQLDISPAGINPDPDPIGGKAAYVTLGATLILTGSDLHDFQVFSREARTPSGLEDHNGAALSVTEGGVLVVDDCVFEGNIAHAGGAIEVDDSTASITGSTFRGNAATVQAFVNNAMGGGAIFSKRSSLTVSATTFEDNVALTGQGGDILIADGDMDIAPSSFSSQLGPGIASAGARAGRDGGSIAIFYAAVTVDGMEVSDAQAAAIRSQAGSDFLDGWGGALMARSPSELTVRDLTVTSSNAVIGGAIAIIGGTEVTVLEDLTLIGNTADEAGQVVLYGSNVSLTNAILQDGAAVRNGGCMGAVESTVEIADSSLVGCRAGSTTSISSAGGGLWSLDSDLTIRSTDFIDNAATSIDEERGFGGHLAMKHDESLGINQVSLQDVLFEGGQAGTGGAIGLLLVKGTLTDVLFRDNTAAVVGGALALGSPTSLSLERPAFCGNSAPQGTAVAVGRIEGTTGSALNLHNAIFRANDGASPIWANDVPLTLRHTTFFANSVGGSAELVDAVDGAQVTLANGLVFRADETALVANLDGSTFNASDTAWWPSLPADSAIAGTNPLLINDAQSDFDTGTDFCANPWVWPTLESDAVVRTPPPGSEADLDGSAPDPGAAGGLLADPLLWGDDDDDGVANFHDCAPEDAGVYPGAAESCNGVDDDCNGAIDEGVTGTYYRDSDGDSWGVDTDTATCPGEGFVARSGDCDDGDDQRFPTNPEQCDGLNNNCDEVIDEGFEDTWYTDADGDSYGDPATGHNCPSEGDVLEGGDCNDTDGTISPGVGEHCNGIDDDCDGVIDNGATVEGYVDEDGDSYGAGPLVTACSGEVVPDGTDCDDGDVSVNPGAQEACDGQDTDCNGLLDDNAPDATDQWTDLDQDGVGGAPLGRQCPTETTASVPGDCDDADPAVQEGPCDQSQFLYVSGGCRLAPLPVSTGALLAVALLTTRRRRRDNRDSR